MTKIRNMKKLTPAEEEIMRFFWEFGANTVSGIIDRMEEPKPPHSTISSIVRILEKKGYLDHKSYGRTYEYYPVLPKKAYQRFSLKRLAAGFFNNDPEELLSFIVKEENVDRQALQKLLDDLENNPS
jgi:predicted transcriptional regulator